ncbi:MAG: DUF6249 domain-containing protein [Bacteroidota bacterium]
MHEGIVALLIPITVSLGAFMMVWGIRYLQNRENMAMIERGMDPTKIKRQRHADPSQTLRNSLMFVGAGLGLLLAIVITKTLGMNGDEGTGIYFSLIAIFGGLGMLGAYLYERKNPPNFPE